MGIKQNNYRELANKIASYLLKKGYYRDIQNNIFTKKCSNEYYDFNEIRFYEGYVIISNLHSKSIHKIKIANLINLLSMAGFKEIMNNYLKLSKIYEQIS